MRVLFMVLWGLFYGPKILAYLPVWLLGVAVYSALQTQMVKSLPRLFGIGLFLMGPILYVSLKFVLKHEYFSMYQPNSYQELAKGAIYYFEIGCVVSINVIGFDVMTSGLSFWPEWCVKCIRWLAGGSFTLYLVHEPVLALTRAVVPLIAAKIVPGMLATATTIVVAYMLAECAERRKAVFKGALQIVVRRNAGFRSAMITRHQIIRGSHSTEEARAEMRVRSPKPSKRRSWRWRERRRRRTWR